MDSLHARLRHARLQAGLKSGSAAARRFGWIGSTYLAHENGQNQYDHEQAEIYGKSFNVSPEWLLYGDRPDPNIDQQLRELPKERADFLINTINRLIAIARDQSKT